MNTHHENNNSGISRRDALKLAGLSMGGLSMGGLAVGGTAGVQAAGKQSKPVDEFYPTRDKTDRYSYFEKLKAFHPGTPPEADEMRITFLGSMIPPVRRAQQEMSIFVEVGRVKDPVTQQWRAKDQFVFDCGSGVCANYGAMGIPYSEMDKVFLCHLHGDHMSDLCHIYCFGPSAGRYSPLFVWGPNASGITYTDPTKPAGNVYGPYDDGLTTYCQMLRAAMRWHSESFSFQNTSYQSYPAKAPTKDSWGLPVEPIPVRDPRAPYVDRYNDDDYVDSPCDGYALIPIELDWTKDGKDANGVSNEDNIAYQNAATQVKITHFPVVHCRRGSIGYKLEWTTPSGSVLTMIYTSDTKPETISIDQAINGGKGVDVFIHEMVVPPEVWAMKNAGLAAPPAIPTPEWNAAVAQFQMVQNSSHTPQGAFGYLLSLLEGAHTRPRLTVATHFPVADDTVDCAFNSVLAHCPNLGKLGEKITWSFDNMVISVTSRKIQQFRAIVPDYGWSPPVVIPGDVNPAKYWTWDETKTKQVGDPFAQIDMSNVIPAEVTDADGNVIQVNYRTDGY